MQFRRVYSFCGGGDLLDHPDYLLDSSEDCLAAQEAVNLPDRRILFDIYHMQTMGGNIVAFLRQNMDWLGYLHVAGVPDRHEPQESGLNSPFILREIDRMSFRGHVGLEYWPLLEPAESLTRALRWPNLVPAT